MFDIRAYLDGISAKAQRERSKTQLTLGGLIAALKAMPPDAVVANIGSPHSYRGYYSDLAFERGDGTRPAAELLAEALRCMGRVFEGYKGGDYVMGETTPLWIAECGDTGDRLMAINAGGGMETSPEPEWEPES